MTAKLTVELMDGTVHEFYSAEHAQTDAELFAFDRQLSCNWALLDGQGRVIALVTGKFSPSGLEPITPRSVDRWRGLTGE